MSYNELSDRQNKILSLKEKGYTFEQIGKEVGMTEEIVRANYYYSKQKITTGIPNKDTVLTEKQKEDIKEAVLALKDYLKELKELNDSTTQENSFDPKDLIHICKEMAEKVGLPFDEGEFI